MTYSNVVSEIISVDWWSDTQCIDGIDRTTTFNPTLTITNPTLNDGSSEVGFSTVTYTISYFTPGAV
jgi:hypothetical protein